MKSLGIVEPSGSVKHAVAMKIIKYVSKDPVLGQQIIGYIAKHFYLKAKRRPE